MIAMLLVVLFVPTFAAADQYDDQIYSYRQQLEQNQAAANQKSAEADTLKNKIAILQSQINAANAALNLTRTQIAQTQAQIDQANRELDRQKAILKENLKVIYKDGDVSPLELIASSKDLNDFVSQRTYLEAIKKKIDEAIVKIDKLKEELTKKKRDLDRLALDQKAQLDTIAAQKAEQDSLLAQTQGEEAKYQQLVAQNRSAMNAVIAARAEAIRQQNLSVSGSGCGGYPSVWCNAPQDSVIDSWSYPNRQCTSYVAWRRAQMGKPVGFYWGNAGTWMRFTNASSPQPGDIMVMPESGYAPVGHVAIVESNNGGSVTISQYNWDIGSGPGRYSVMTIPFGSSILSGVRYIR
ncbi:CHAP domain-containing protein [bacterium]|nr:CHAP domain-containing protein [bacterium]